VEVGDYYTIFYPMLEVNTVKYHMCSSRLSIAIKYCLKIYAPCSYCKYTEELRKEENQFILQANITNCDQINKMAKHCKKRYHSI
jgi:hypothetical protein